MPWFQKTIELKDRARGFHLITREILAAVPAIEEIDLGIVQVFIQHTSASLTLNENAAPEVRTDFETVFNRLVPENQKDYLHTEEGPDDLPAHIKSSLLGSSVTIPIANGRFLLGTWQGIYLCEHRNCGGPRRLVVTGMGQ